MSQPRCIASSDAEPPQCDPDNAKVGRSIFYQAQFSGDGTTLVTHHGDHSFRSYILPPDLLHDGETVKSLTPQASIPSASAIQSCALFPQFNLQDYATTVFLAASTDLPIAICNAITGESGFYKYPLVNPTTEAYIAPSSLAWTRAGSHFITGSRDQLSYFDAQSTGSGPIRTTRTSPGRRQRRMFGDLPVCKGMITALSTSSEGMLAAGSTERQVALYADEGAGECWTSFYLPEAEDAGTGVMHLAWSTCGTYLLAAERQSDGIYVYDVRNTLRQVSFLAGRNADTTQRLAIDVVPTSDGYEVWAGGKDGCVRMWKGAGHAEGHQLPDEQWKVHDDPVSSVVWHPQGSVFATCSGRPRTHKLRYFEDVERIDDGNVPDNTLKIWTL